MIIPDTVTGIADGAFAYCDHLTDVSIPSSVSSIGYGAFEDCPWLEAQTEQFVIVGDGVLIDYNGADSEVYVPAGVKQIVGAFVDCYSITTIHLPDSLLAIGDSVFSWCYALTSVAIPDSVTSIGHYAFANCLSLTGIELPDSLVSIGYDVFWGCELTSISVPATVTQCDLWSFAEQWPAVVAPEGSAAAIYRDAAVRMMAEE